MRRRLALLAVVACLSTGCALFDDDPEQVFSSAEEAVEVSYEAPQYAIESRRSLYVRRGETDQLLRRTFATTWLNDGRLLGRAGRKHWDNGCVGYECWKFWPVVIDPARGAPTRVPGMPLALALPALPRWSLDLLGTGRRQQLVSFSPDLAERTVTGLPPYDGPEGYTQRDYGGGHTVGDATYLRFSDTINEESTEEYGYLRVRDGEVDKVLVGERIVALWVSDDGRALLGLRQRKGEPCGGCVVEQEIVEIDPASGEIAATYGMPDEYDESWRVHRIDKVGDVVAVRFEGGCGRMPCLARELGVWIYDGDWSMVEGSDRARTWWQGPEDRIELRHGRRPASARLVWVHGDEERELSGRLLRDGWLVEPLVPGSLLRPVE